MTNKQILDDFRSAQSRINRLAGQGELGKAIDLARSLMRQYPDNDDLLVHTALLLTRMKKPDDVVQLLGGEVRHRVEPKFLYLLGNAYFTIEKYVLAAEILRDARPADEGIIKTRAHALLLSGQTTEAEAVLRDSYTRFPTITGAVRHWAIEAMKSQKHDLARHIIGIAERLDEIGSKSGVKKAQGKPKTHGSVVRHPNREERRNYAEWLLASGELDRTYQAMDQVHLAVRSGTRDAVATVVDMANELRKQRHYGAALRVLTRGRRSIPDSAVIARLMGEILLVTGSAQQAIAVLREARVLDPSDASSIHLLGNALERTNKIEEAISVLQEGHAAHPNEISITASLGRMMGKNGQYVAALRIVEAALTNNPDNARLNGTFGGILLEARDYASFDLFLEQLPEKTARTMPVVRANAYGRFLRHESEAARRILEPLAAVQRSINAVSVLYIACADTDDAILVRMKSQMGERAFEKASALASDLRPDAELIPIVGACHNPATSQVMSKLGLYTRPVNRGAQCELLGQEQRQPRS